MVSARTILDWLLTHVLLLTLLGLVLSITNFALSCQIDNYNNEDENATFNTLFTNIKYLEAHLIRIDNALIIIDAHLDFIDSQQSKDSKAYNTYKGVKQKQLSKIINETNFAMRNFANASLNSSNYSDQLQEKKHTFKDFTFWVMIFLIIVSFVLLLLQFNQNNAPPQKEASQKEKHP